MNWLLSRLKERSTWSAVITLAGITGLSIAPELKEQIITAATAIVAVIFAITSDPPKVAAIAQEVANVKCAEVPQTIVSPELTEEQQNELQAN
jgi:hypothetical protein